MKLFKRTVSLVLSLAMTASMFVSTVSAAGKTFEGMGVTANDIVVLYTNDVRRRFQQRVYVRLCNLSGLCRSGSR